ncbi:MAG: 2TM domain-containing protein, partial [Myxococcales bacterium]|nr:2TM domain-containing protein [Myxococcales bacterium]
MSAERELQAVIEGRRRRRRSALLRSAITYVIVAAAGLIAYLGFEVSWPLWVLLIWGFVLSLSALKVFLPDEERERRRAERVLERRRYQEAQRRRKLERSRRGRGVEEVIEQGVGAILGALARGVEEALSPP